MRDVCLTETIMNAKNLFDECANAIQSTESTAQRAKTTTTMERRDQQIEYAKNERERESAKTMRK